MCDPLACLGRLYMAAKTNLGMDEGELAQQRKENGISPWMTEALCTTICKYRELFNATKREHGPSHTTWLAVAVEAMRKSEKHKARMQAHAQLEFFGDVTKRMVEAYKRGDGKEVHLLLMIQRAGKPRTYKITKIRAANTTAGEQGRCPDPLRGARGANSER